MTGFLHPRHYGTFSVIKKRSEDDLGGFRTLNADEDLAALGIGYACAHEVVVDNGSIGGFVDGRGTDSGAGADLEGARDRLKLIVVGRFLDADADVIPSLGSGCCQRRSVV